MQGIVPFVRFSGTRVGMGILVGNSPVFEKQECLCVCGAESDKGAILRQCPIVPCWSPISSELRKADVSWYETVSTSKRGTRHIPSEPKHLLRRENNLPLAPTSCPNQGPR